MLRHKGNLLVGQSGGPTAVINSTLAGVIQEALAHEEVGGIYGMVNGIQGLLSEEMYDLRRQGPDLVQALKHTPGSALGSCRYRMKPEDYGHLLEIFEAHNVRFLLYIGGNDSADTSLRIDQAAVASGHEMCVIGLPKTVDNDLAHTDHCPGYGSAARYLAITTMEIGLDHRSMRTFDGVKFLEAMGRNAGWLPAATALGKRGERDAPHLVYVPEKPVSLEEMLNDIQRVFDRYGYATVVVSESTRDEDGEILVKGASAIETDSFGHHQPGGVAEFLVQTVMGRLGIKARADKPGTMQRSSMAIASRVDLEEAFALGVEGVRAAVRGVSGKMPVLVRDPGPAYHCSIEMIDLELVANHERLLPDEFMDYERHMPTRAFHDYAVPLLGDPLPEYRSLREARVEKLLAGR